MKRILIATLLFMSAPVVAQTSLIAQVGSEDRRLGVQISTAINEILSVQAGYSERRGLVRRPPGGIATEETDTALGADVVFTLPATANIAVLLSVGLHAVRTEKTTGAAERIAFGGEYRIGRHWATRLEVEGFLGSRGLLSLRFIF